MRGASHESAANRAAEEESRGHGSPGREALFASLGILLTLGGLKHLAWVWPWFHDNPYFGLGAAGAAVQLYAPILRLDRNLRPADLGLSLKPWRTDLAAFAALSALTVVPFALGHHYWQTAVAGRTYVPALPGGLGGLVLTHVLVVALPEELFFRGYLQQRLEQWRPARRTLLGAPFGLAIVLQAAVFSLAHFVGEYQLDRLATFFPALLFGLLRARSGSILGAVGYHAFCNVLAAVLFASYEASPAGP